MCGEKFGIFSHAVDVVGSPPRVRGKACPNSEASRAVGITPACAGKSTTELFQLQTDRDHPRVCGEKCRATKQIRRIKGSPPRVRGKARPMDSDSISTRITPACAGKSRLPRYDCMAHRDHPRVCGEKLFVLLRLPSAIGSPPRVRGKVEYLSDETPPIGITPACAGKRSAYPHGHSGGWDHPRVCGEKPVNHFRASAHQGSPPRVRGKVIGSMALFAGVRITPACAGKRFFNLHIAIMVWDHPRVCGEK